MNPTSSSSDRRSTRDLHVSVVLPVFNEAAVLEQLLAAVQDSLEEAHAKYEVLFVNDGSTDASGEIMDQMAADDARVRVIHLSRNFGHQPAVHAGLAHASGDVVVLMDSDMQDDPAAISRFIEAWRQGYDVVYAVRTERKETAVKRFLFTSYYRLLDAVSSTKMPLDAGNFCLLDCSVAREICALGETDRYFPGLRSWVGFRQTGVQVERLARYDDTPRVSYRGLFRLAKTAIFSFSSTPLAFFYVIGHSALAIFLALGGFSLYCRLFTDLAIPGWTSHILSASFFGALNALGISVLGEYVTRIYDQVRQRPTFIVDRTENLFAEEGRTTGSAGRVEEQLLGELNAVRASVERALASESAAASRTRKPARKTRKAK